MTAVIGYTAEELRMIGGALAEMALARRRAAGSRRYAGARLAGLRAEMREDAKRYEAMSARAYAASERAS